MPMLVLALSWLAFTSVRQPDDLDDALSELLRAIRVVDARQKYRKLIAAETCHRVALADAILQPFGDEFQQPVAHRMTECVVDFLEVVEIQEEQGEPAAAIKHLQLFEHAFTEQDSIGQTGEEIVVCEKRDLRDAGLERREGVDDCAEFVGASQSGDIQGLIAPCHGQRCLRDQPH